MMTSKIEPSSRTVLITGAGGFLGGFLVERYVELGWTVHGTVRSASPGHVNPAATLHPMDLEQPDAVRGLIATIRPDLVHHLAAQSSVRISSQEPLKTLLSNLVMQRNVLDGVLQNGITARVVVVGSADEYGCVDPADNPISESFRLLPVNAYGLSKVGQDLMGYEYFAARGMAVVRVRPFLQIGPRRPDSFAAGSFARQVAEIELGRRPPVIHTGNIDQVRDMCDVRDVSVAMSLVAEMGQPGDVYNVASGTGHTHREIIDRMLQLSGMNVKVQEDRSLLRSIEPAAIVGDSTRLRQATGWVPQISFERSVADTLQYWRDRLRSIEPDATHQESAKAATEKVENATGECD